jgi:hypothetical protein
MQKLRGTIYNGDGIVLDGINVSLDYTPDTKAPLSEWCGDFLLAAAPPFNPGDSFRLVLSDGRSGDILIRRCPPPIYGVHQVVFQGSGLLS